MRYAALVDGSTEAVEVHQAAPGRFVVTIGERRLDVAVQLRGDGEMTLLTGDTVHALQIERHGGTHRVHGARGHRDVEILNLRQHQLRQAQRRVAAADGAAAVRAPMPGRVVAVLVAPGDTVRRHQGLVVIEAMKMENELKAPRDGVVEALPVAVGDAVDRGVTLCRIG